MSAGNGDPAAAPVTDNQSLHRLELVQDARTAFLDYRRQRHAFVLVHTEVPEALRGRHLGERLVRAGLDLARSEGLKIVVLCPFARAYLRRHPEIAPEASIPGDA